MKKKIFIIFLCLFLTCIALSGCSNKEELDINSSKLPYVKNGNWWIDNIDTGIKSTNVNGKKKTKIVDYYLDSKYHLWIEFSDNNKMDLGYAGNITEKTTVNEKYTVTFLDYDGTKLSVQMVEKGEAVNAPSEPAREGYRFIGWDKPFDSINSDLLIKAEYVQDKEPLIFANTVHAAAGERGIEVTVSVENNPGILGMSLGISYDESVINLVEVANGEAVKDKLTLTKAKQLKNGCRFAWDGQEIMPEDVKDGVVLTLKFDISATAKKGEYPIIFSYSDGDIVDNNLNTIKIPIENGSIIIS